jgi:hypothetical protein
MQFENPFKRVRATQARQECPPRITRRACAAGPVLTQRFPVLHYGSTPKYKSLDDWTFRVFGLVEAGAHLHLGRTDAVAAQHGDGRYSLRHALEQARYDVDGRTLASVPHLFSCQTRSHACDGALRAGFHDQRRPRRARRRRHHARLCSTRASRWNRITAIRCACSCPRSISGRAPSGCAASSL